MDEQPSRSERTRELASAAGEIVRNTIVAVSAAKDLLSKPKDDQQEPRAGFRR